MTTLIAQGPVDVFVGRLFGLRQPVRIDGLKAEFSKAIEGPVFRVCATIYNPTNPGPYNDLTWDTKLAAVVVFGRAVLSMSIRRLPPNAGNERTAD
jgi:hypothetical protein